MRRTTTVASTPHSSPAKRLVVPGVVGTDLADRSPQTQPIRRLVSIPGVLSAVPINRSTLWRWVRAGKFPAPIRVGRRTFFRAEDLNRWIG